MGVGFWEFLSVLEGALTDLLPLLPAIRLSSFLDRWPPHFVFYVLEDKQNEKGEALHLERNKSYILDLMMVPKCKESLHMAKNYYFA